MALNLENRSFILSLALWARFQPMACFVVALEIPGKWLRRRHSVNAWAVRRAVSWVAPGRVKYVTGCTSYIKYSSIVYLIKVKIHFASLQTEHNYSFYTSVYGMTCRHCTAYMKHLVWKQSSSSPCCFLPSLQLSLKTLYTNCVRLVSPDT